MLKVLLKFRTAICKTIAGERVRFERQSVFVFVYTVVRTLVYRVHSWSIVNLERHLLIDRTFVKFDFCTVATLLNLNRTLHGSI